MLTPKKLARATPGTASAVIYTAASAVRTRIDAFAVVNYSASPITFSVWLVPTGSVADNSTILISARSIASGASARVLEAIGQWIEGLGAIHMSASAATSLTVNVSGVEQTTA